MQVREGMRVLVNVVSAVAGGGVTYILELLKGLPAAAPDDEFVFVFHEDLALPVLPAFPNLRIRRVRPRWPGFAGRYGWENTELIALVREIRADVVFFPGNILPVRSVGARSGVMVQNVAPLTPRVRRDLFRYEGWAEGLRMLMLQALTHDAVRRADQVISLSQATRALVARRCGGRDSAVLYHGIGERFHPGAARPGGAPPGPYFLYVSNIYVYKGLEYLVQALRVDPGLPPVVVVGKTFNQGYRRAMERLAERDGVGHRLIFQDHVAHQDLPGWYAHAEALVYPSWCENCPNILMEAMGCGCPVVGMWIGPMPEICGPGGIFVPAFDGWHLAKGMRHVLAPGIRDRLGRAGRGRAAQFTWERAVQDHLDVFRQAVWGDDVQR